MEGYMTTVENPYEKVRSKMVTARIEFMGQLAKFGRDELDKQPGTGEWSPLQLAYHLYIADGLALEELKHIQDEDNPLVVATEEEAPRRTNASKPPATLDTILAGMAARPEKVFEFISTFLTEAWESPLRHPPSGQRKFYQMVNVLPLPDPMHGRQSAEI